MQFLKETHKQMRWALLVLFILIFGGSAGYFLLEGWSWADSLYMTIITISTTGFGEVRPLSEAGRVFTSLLIISGVGTLAYAAGQAIKILTETGYIRRRRMFGKIERLKNHYIICGFGRMGKHICEELKDLKATFVVLEKNEENCTEMDALGYLYVQGDATKDDLLLAAGIKRAKGLVSVLAGDADNVFTTLSAKVINPDIFIVSRAIEDETEIKLKRAGASRVVKPYEIGGTRMAQVLVRPHVVDFIDQIARQKNINLSLEEISVGSHSPLVGKRLADSGIRSRLNIIIVAVHKEDGEFIYNPGSGTVIEKGDQLIAIGAIEFLEQLNELCLQ